MPVRPRRRRPAARRRRLRRPLARPRRRRSTSSRPTSTRCSPRRRRTSSPSATPPTVPASKAGSVTHFEGEIARRRTSRASSHGEPLEASFDGHANCFIETGFHKALLIDFNYDNEPRRRPLPRRRRPAAAQGVAPQPPRQALFQWFYWHVLLPGRDIPGITPTMPTAGKHPRSTTATKEGSDHDHRNHRRRRRRRQRRRLLRPTRTQWTEDMAPELARPRASTT